MGGRREARGATLIIGGGFAGSWVARKLGRRGATIVSPENFTLFTPLLPEAASGAIEPRHVVVPLRMMCPHAELVLGRAVEIDFGTKTVTVDTAVGELPVGFTDLVVAVGAVSRTLPIPGLVEHAIGFKTLPDAIHLRNHVLRELELADAQSDPSHVAAHLSYVFVGAGYAGVEALAELRELVRDALRYYPRLRGIEQRWLLVDAAPKILPEIPKRLGEYAARHLLRTDTDIRTGTTLDAIEEGIVHLSDGTRIAARTIVWTAGDRGRVVVDEALRVEGNDGVWSLGDCAAVTNRATPGRLDPPTCQHALRQARRLARNLAASRAGRKLRPYRYRMLGQVATSQVGWSGVAARRSLIRV